VDLTEFATMLREAAIVAHFERNERLNPPFTPLTNEEAANVKLLEWLALGAEAAVTKKLSGQIHPRV
jgi:hypothetical protein